ncbi:MAG: hypothetical protein A2W91_18370 [Bacteroidetes bacterium GWF2_38_335]|nr:MAG: hypothetical protein A2W91_18370 [Bacteroidetes bacterium GWF2_38_335]OFY80069.1 MAG: hypothetical protein A2281_12265 [Bacteroidetes bacterium RIFOXYA12_FULL_38_20]HBS88606.1 hypothetical protein [Bacteroidales bacterium]
MNIIIPKKEEEKITKVRAILCELDRPVITYVKDDQFYIYTEFDKESTYKSFIRELEKSGIGTEGLY